MPKTHPHIEMPSEEDLGRIAADKPEVIRQLYLDAHRAVLAAVPEVRYSVDCVDAAIGYGARQFGYDGWGMVVVTPYKHLVRVTLMQGANMDDPDGLLEGAALMRHIKLSSLEQFAANRDAIRQLIEAAVHVHE